MSDTKHDFHYEHHHVVILDNGCSYEARIDDKPLISKFNHASILVTAQLPEQMKKKAMKAIDKRIAAAIKEVENGRA